MYSMCKRKKYKVCEEEFFNLNVSIAFPGKPAHCILSHFAACEACVHCVICKINSLNRLLLHELSFDFYDFE